MDYPIIKYPRTPHLAGSRLQPGDEDLSQVPFSCPAGRRLVQAIRLGKTYVKAQGGKK